MPRTNRRKSEKPGVVLDEKGGTITFIPDPTNPAVYHVFHASGFKPKKIKRLIKNAESKFK